DFVDGWRADLARLEWARHDVFDAPDEPILGQADVLARGETGIADLQVQLVAAHRLVDMTHAGEPVWRAPAPARAPHEPPREPRRRVVWREGVAVSHRRVDEVEREALAAAARGLPFGALCERLVGPDAAARLLLRWIRDQLLVAL